jgi:hypothetical protein
VLGDDPQAEHGLMQWGGVGGGALQAVAQAQLGLGGQGMGEVVVGSRVHGAHGGRPRLKSATRRTRSSQMTSATTAMTVMICAITGSRPSAGTRTRCPSLFPACGRRARRYVRRMQRSLDLPGFVRLSGSSLDCAEMMRPRTPAAREPGPWLPRREIRGFDAVTDAADFRAWIEAAVEGEAIAYFCGPCLPAARLADPVLDELAREVMLASAGGSLLRVSQCFHIRGRFVGSREVKVSQRRVLPPVEPDDAPSALHGAERCWWLHLCRRLP